MRKLLVKVLRYAPYIPVFGAYIILIAAASDINDSEVEFYGEGNDKAMLASVLIQTIGAVILLVYLIGTIIYFII